MLVIQHVRMLSWQLNFAALSALFTKIKTTFRARNTPWFRKFYPWPLKYTMASHILIVSIYVGENPSEYKGLNLYYKNMVVTF